MLPKNIVEKKAELIQYGKIYIPKEITLPFYPSRSTAGPGAGARALVFGFHGTRVKLSLVPKDQTVFSLTRKPKSEIENNLSTNSVKNQTIRECIEGKSYTILKDGKPFLDNVILEPTIMHAPKQAFINITHKCIYNCSFCVTPNLDKSGKGCTVDRWIELILAHSKNSNLEGIAITSGVAESPHKTVLDMVKIIKTVHEKLPKIPIGVEPYITENKDVDLLFDAGAREIKINLETPNKKIFDKICPGMDYTVIYNALSYAVSVFGRNQVCSNLLIGLGETDEEILQKIEELANIGVVVTLRALRINEINKPSLTNALGFEPTPVPSTRLIKLAEKHRQILDKYDLHTGEFKTMCHRCKSCDLVPQQDI